MDRALFEKNYQAMREVYSGFRLNFAFEDEAWEPTEDDLFFVEVKGRTYQMSSSYGMELPIQVWLEQDELAAVEYNSVILVFGMGNPLYIDALAQRYPENDIIVFEPCQRLMQAWCWAEDLTELIESEHVWFYVGTLEPAKINPWLAFFMRYDNVRNCRIVAVPNYMIMYQEEYLCLKGTYLKLIDTALINKASMLYFNEDWSFNTLYSFLDIADQCKGTDLCEATKSSGLCDYPAVIVSAGPSLEGNIEVLKAYQDRIFIIGINRSMRILEAHGIKPHMAVAIDPGSEVEQAGGPEMWQVPLVTATSASAQYRKVQRGRRFYYAGDLNAYNYFRRLGCELMPCPNGGSVATVAFKQAIEMGFKRIIVIGQDLAFKDGQQYSMQSFNAQRDFLGQEISDVPVLEGYYWVEGNNGQKVVTKYDYDYYRQMFERNLQECPEVHLINATEGGALIHGSEVMTLAAALKRECTRPLPDVEAIFDSVPTIFGDCEGEYRQHLARLEENLPQLKVDIGEALEVYAKLEKLIRNNSFNHPNMSKYLAKVSKYNTRLDQDPTMLLLDQFSMARGYEVQDALAQKTGDSNSEIRLIVEQGAASLKGYLEAIDKVQDGLARIKQMREQQP